MKIVKQIITDNYAYIVKEMTKKEFKKYNKKYKKKYGTDIKEIK